MERLDQLRKLPSFRLHTNDRVIPDCTAADVEAALHEVYFDRKLAFLVLEPETPIRNVRFLQATGLPNGFQVEMSVLVDGDWQMFARQVAYAETVEKFFSDFMFGRVPSMHGFSPYAL